MRVMVTGGAGFIGSALVRNLLSRGVNVAVYDCMTYAARPQTLAPHLSSSRLVFYERNICDADAVKTAIDDFQPDAILNLAAETHVDRSIASPTRFIQTNVIGTHTLLEATLAYWTVLPSSRASTFRFLQVSTDEVYGSLGVAGLFNEYTAYAPRSPYSASKAAADHLTQAWHHTYGLPTIVTNCSNNYGPYQFPEKLVPLMILRGLSGRPMPIYGKGLNVRDWLFVEDHADALFRIVTNGRPGEKYLIGGECERRNVDIVEAIAAELDALAPDGAPHSRLICFVHDRLGHDYRYAIDPRKCQRELGWRAKTSLKDGLRQTVQWYLANRNWWEPIVSKNYRLERLGAPT